MGGSGGGEADSSFFHDTGVSVVAVHGGVLLQLYYGAPTEETVKTARLGVQTVLDQFQMSMVIVDEPAALPSQGARNELQQMGRSIMPRPVAMVYEGTGFGAAAVRGIVTAMNASSGGLIVGKMVPSVGLGVEWLKQQGPAPGLRDFDAFVADLRKAIKERASNR